MTTFALSGIGVSPGAYIAQRDHVANRQLPSILTSVSDGASLTYQIEVNPELPPFPQNNDGSGTWHSDAAWYPIAAMTGLTTGSDQLLAGVVYGVRARITAWTAGTLNFSVSS